MYSILLAVWMWLNQNTVIGKTNSAKIQWAVVPSKLYIFNPQEDITSYELARIMQLLYGGDLEKLFKEMPTIKRHFK